ncbi:MAG: flagellar filament capping protein FliD [Pseudomonadota bacterium]
MIISPGIGSGLDVNSLVTQLVAAEGAPAAFRLDTQEVGVQAELSAYGTLRSALDAFRTTLERFSDLETFQGRTAISGNEELFTVSATKDANPGSYDVEVEQLATGQKLTSAAYADSDETTVGSGILTFTNGVTAEPPATDPRFSVRIDKEESTLEDIRDAINNADDNFGVSASIVNGDDGARLVITTTDTGEEAALTITASDDDGALAGFVYDVDGGTTNLTESVAAQNARVQIDGFLVTSDNNTITGAIEGVTLNLLKAEVGETASLDISFDRDGGAKAVRDFVDAYNEVVNTMSALSSFDAENNIGGTLLGDSTLRGLSSSLSREIGTPTSGTDSDFSFLSELGISTQFDGTLEIDGEVLNERLAEDFNAVGRLFATEGGYAERLDAVLGLYIDEGGQLDNRTEGLQSQIEDIEQQREDLDRRLQSVEARLRAQFNALDSLVASLNSTSNFLTSQLASIPTPSSGNQ